MANLAVLGTETNISKFNTKGFFNMNYKTWRHEGEKAPLLPHRASKNFYFVSGNFVFQALILTVFVG